MIKVTFSIKFHFSNSDENQGQIQLNNQCHSLKTMETLPLIQTSVIKMFVGEPEELHFYLGLCTLHLENI